MAFTPFLAQRLRHCRIAHGWKRGMEVYRSATPISLTRRNQSAAVDGAKRSSNKETVASGTRRQPKNG
jgi:hypothetical protein